MYLDPDCRPNDDDEDVTPYGPVGEEETLVVSGYDYVDDGTDYAEDDEDED